MLKIEQFFSDGYGERKVQFLIDFATVIMAKHTALSQNSPKSKKSGSIASGDTPASAGADKSAFTPDEDAAAVFKVSGIQPAGVERKYETFHPTNNDNNNECAFQDSEARLIDKPETIVKMPGCGEVLARSELSMIASLLLDLKKVLQLNVIKNIGH